MTRICAYPRARLLRFACGLMVVVWALFLLFATLLAGGMAGVWQHHAITRSLTPLLISFVATALVATLVSSRLRCPGCGRRVLIETGGPFHPTAKVGWGGFGGHYAPVVVAVLRHGRFTCMHCGVECRVSGADRSPAEHP